MICDKDEGFQKMRFISIMAASRWRLIKTQPHHGATKTPSKINSKHGHTWPQSHVKHKSSDTSPSILLAVTPKWRCHEGEPGSEICWEPAGFPMRRLQWCHVSPRVCWGSNVLLYVQSLPRGNSSTLNVMLNIQAIKPVKILHRIGNKIYPIKNNTSYTLQGILVQSNKSQPQA